MRTILRYVLAVFVQTFNSSAEQKDFRLLEKNVEFNKLFLSSVVRTSMTLLKNKSFPGNRNEH